MLKKLLIATTFLVLLTTNPVKADETFYRGWATAYCQKGQTATGTQTKEGRTIASKPEWEGMTMYVWFDEGDGLIKPENFIGAYIVEDTGSDNIKKGYVIDIYMENLNDCKQFGGKRVIWQLVNAKG